jgi:hypothetical protein
VFSANANAWIWGSQPHPMENFISDIAKVNGNSDLEIEFFLKAYTKTKSDSAESFSKRFNIEYKCDVKVISVVSESNLHVFMADRGDTFTLKGMDQMIRGFKVKSPISQIICKDGKRFSIS